MPIIIVLVALAVAGGLGFLAATGAQYALILMVGTLIVGALAFFSPKLSLVLLIFSMLLSPELGFGAITELRSIVVRYDDILLVIIFLSWFARTAIFKNKPFITSTPVQTPVLLYTVLCVLSTAVGVMRGDVSWKVSVFYVLKYIEYFLLFFMTVNIVESEEEVKGYLKYGFIVAVIVTLYAYYYYYASGPTARATAPFEAPIGNPADSEPASLGGYYLIIFGVLLSLLSGASGSVVLLALGALIFMFPAFLFTFSRASYIGISAMLPALFFLSKQRRLFMLGLASAALIALALTPSVSDKVIDRISMTYQGTYATQTFQAGSAGSIKLEDSAASRVYSIKRVLFDKFPEHPIIGWGVTGVGLGDTQYALVIGELGILGVGLFIWMLYKLFYTAKMIFMGYDSAIIKAMALGFMVSMVGLLFQSLGVNTFIVVRVMEPFWFIAAMLSALYVKKYQPAGAVPEEDGYEQATK